MNGPYSWSPWLHPEDYPPGVISESGAAASMNAPVPASGDYSISGQVPPLEPSSRGPLPDYMAGIDRAMEENRRLGEEKPKGGLGQFLLSWAGFMGDNLSGNPAYSRFIMHKLAQQEDEAERRRKAMAPQQVGNSMIVPDGMGGFRTVYSAPTDAERYAADLGLARGSDEWANAIREYRAPAWSPWALEGKEHIEGVRYGHRAALQDDRQEYGRSMQEDRQSHSDAQLGRRLGVQRRGQDMTDKRVRGSAAYQGRGGSSRTPRSDLIGPVYQRGNRRVQFSKSAGGYVDLATGERVN